MINLFLTSFKKSLADSHSEQNIVATSDASAFSIADIIIESKSESIEDAWKISIIDNVKRELQPSNIRIGTKVEIRDLFSRF